jgi:hypothetical protein
MWTMKWYKMIRCIINWYLFIHWDHNSFKYLIFWISKLRYKFTRFSNFNLIDDHTWSLVLMIRVHSIQSVLLSYLVWQVIADLIKFCFIYMAKESTWRPTLSLGRLTYFSGYLTGTLKFIPMFYQIPRGKFSRRRN